MKSAGLIVLVMGIMGNAIAAHVGNAIAAHVAPGAPDVPFTGRTDDHTARSQ